MQERIQNQLFLTAILTFEELGFLLPSKELSEEQGEAVLQEWASAKFSGAFDGEIVLRMSKGALEEVATNMLGCEGGVTLAQQHDALGEIANVFCGNLLPAISGTQSEFSIEAPKTGSGEYNELGSEAVQLRAQVDVGLELDDRAEVMLFVTRSAETALELG